MPAIAFIFLGVFGYALMVGVTMAVLQLLLDADIDTASLAGLFWPVTLPAASAYGGLKAIQQKREERRKASEAARKQAYKSPPESTTYRKAAE